MLEFGFSRENITPTRGIPLCGYFNPRPNKGYLDPLAVKAAVFRAGGVTAGFVSFDLCYITRELVEKLIAAMKEAGVCCADNLMFSTVHTHTGPYTAKCFDDCTDSKYLSRLIQKTVMAVEDAVANLAPAELYATTAESTTLSFNRRYWMKDGSVLTNPGKLNPDIDRPEGPIDPQIPFLAVKQDGFFRMFLVNISNHSDTIGGDLVSAYWSGKMEHAVQSELGYDIPVVTLCGPQGNINHFNVKTAAGQTSYPEATRIGKGYASALLQSIYALNKVEVDSIQVDHAEMEVPYRKVTDAEYADAKATVERFKDATMEAGRDFTSEDIARKHPYVMKYFAQRLCSCRDNAIPGRRMEQLIAIKFGDQIGVVSMPAEPFVEIGLNVKKASRFPLTLVAALAQGEVGYVALPENYTRGIAAYETAPNNESADTGVGSELMATATDLLNR